MSKQTTTLEPDFPSPKYRKGQKVYYACHSTTGARYPCPDCYGTRKWTCTSPAGHTMEMDCPRCDRTSHSDALNLSYTKHTFYAQELTIGSIRVDTASHGDHPISYMCEETGVGTGTVYYEPRLYATREEAEAAAAVECDEQQAKHDAMPESMRRLEFSRKPYFRALEAGLWESLLATFNSGATP